MSSFRKRWDSKMSGLLTGVHITDVYGDTKTKKQGRDVAGTVTGQGNLKTMEMGKILDGNWLTEAKRLFASATLQSGCHYKSSSERTAYILQLSCQRARVGYWPLSCLTRIMIPSVFDGLNFLANSIKRNALTAAVTVNFSFPYITNKRHSDPIIHSVIELHQWILVGVNWFKSNCRACPPDRFSLSLFFYLRRPVSPL